MEHGSFLDHTHSHATFSLADEDHTLANAARFVLNQEMVIVPAILSTSFFNYEEIFIEGLKLMFDEYYATFAIFELNFESPRATFCGYSIPHPSHARVNVRVQTTRNPAREVLVDACQDLMLMNRHVRSAFDKAVSEFKKSNQTEPMNVEQ